MVKRAGFQPGPVAIMPLWYVRLASGRHQRPQMGDDGTAARSQPRRAPASSRPRCAKSQRFSTITARTVLLGGAKSPDSISGPLLDEIAAAIPSSAVVVLPGLGHLAPQDQRGRVASAVLAN